MKWYMWNSLEAFNTWHSTLATSLNYPLPSYNQATGLIDESIPMTTVYTTVIFYEEKWLARVEDIYATGLVEATIFPVPNPLV